MSIEADVIRAEFEKHPGYSRDDHLSRSIFDVDPGSVLRALCDRDDDRLPLLAANALRQTLQDDPSWDACHQFVVETLEMVQENPAQFGKDTANATRNSSHFDASRATARGVLFHAHYSEDPLYKLSDSTGYGMMWAHDRNKYEGIDLRNKIVATFVVANELGAHVQGDWAHELVQPALVFNSAIEGALLSYDLQPAKYICHARHLWVSRTDEPNLLEAFEHTEAQDAVVDPADLFNREASMGDMQKIAEITYDRSADQFVVDGPDRYGRVLAAAAHS